MKGPYERLKYDFRRVFECPVCHRRVRVPGSVTFMHCSCDRGAKTAGEQRPIMKLIEDGPRRTDGEVSKARSRWPVSDNTSEA
jgi:hypothetical protein